MNRVSLILAAVSTVPTVMAGLPQHQPAEAPSVRSSNADSSELNSVTFRVLGLMKTKSGAT